MALDIESDNSRPTNRARVSSTLIVRIIVAAVALLIFGGVAAVRFVQQRADAAMYPPLVRAVRDNDQERIHALIKAHADVNARQRTGFSFAHPGHGYDAMDTDGMTPLIIAGGWRSIQVIDDLVAAGADINAKDADGNTPLMWACINKRLDLAMALVVHHPDMNAKNNYGRTALVLSTGSRRLIPLLKSAGATGIPEAHIPALQPPQFY